MVFLPKRTPYVNPGGQEYLRPEDTRPLSIVNTDNRLIANALRIRIEPLLEKAISQQQQGFLCGRSLLRNVVEVDAEMRVVTMECQEPAAVFFDFQAAFPSVGHTFLRAALSAAGVPASVRRLVDCLYWGHACRLSVGGCHHEGFAIKSGIRQGCPLSPLLFALIVDPLLRRLSAQCPQSVIRAYADDVAAVMRGANADLQSMAPVFHEFALASGVFLNPNKVVVVPLGGRSAETMANWIRSNIPNWGAVRCQSWATYLGFVLGPGRGMRSWDRALQKAAERTAFWTKLAIGTQWGAFVYRTYVVSTLGFLSQLEELPP